LFDREKRNGVVSTEDELVLYIMSACTFKEKGEHDAISIECVYDIRVDVLNGFEGSKDAILFVFLFDDSFIDANSGDAIIG
jgi:hypothetical protein